MPLHLGVILPNYGEALDAERLAGVAAAAEQVGFDSGWVTDHVIVPAEQAGTYGTIAEALVSLGFLAARTSRLAPGASALVVPQRQPLVAPQQLITLDFVSRSAQSRRRLVCLRERCPCLERLDLDDLAPHRPEQGQQLALFRLRNVE